MVKNSLSKYGIIDFKTISFPHLDPLPVSTRTLASSNFLLAYRGFKQRRLNTDEAHGGLAGKLPSDYIVVATKELIRWHIGGDRPESAWLPSFHKVVDQIRHLPEKYYNPADVGAFAELLWSSGKDVGGSELCSILNAALRGDDPAVIMHAAVLSCGINARRLINRTPRPGLFIFNTISPNEYPHKLKRGELGCGRWHAGEGVAHGSWRGGGFRDEFQRFFKPGKKYRVPGVLATALDKDVALGFIDTAIERDPDQPRILWCIKVDGRGILNPEHRVMHASFVNKSLIHDDKFTPTESEYLYVAYSAFEVEAVEWAMPDAISGRYKKADYHRVVIRAANDNKDLDQWPEELPLAPWY